MAEQPGDLRNLHFGVIVAPTSGRPVRGPGDFTTLDVMAKRLLLHVGNAGRVLNGVQAESKVRWEQVGGHKTPIKGYSIVVVYRGKNVEKSAVFSTRPGKNDTRDLKFAAARRVGNINIDREYKSEANGEI
jgi:hypothetical protein